MSVKNLLAVYLRRHDLDITITVEWALKHATIYLSPWSWLKCCFTSTLTLGLLGTGAQDGHLDFHTPPGLWYIFLRKNRRDITVSVEWVSENLFICLFLERLPRYNRHGWSGR